MKFFHKSVRRQTPFSSPPPSFHSAGLRGFHLVCVCSTPLAGLRHQVLSLKAAWQCDCY